MRQRKVYDNLETIYFDSPKEIKDMIDSATAETVYLEIKDMDQFKQTLDNKLKECNAKYKALYITLFYETCHYLARILRVILLKSCHVMLMGGGSGRYSAY